MKSKIIYLLVLVYAFYIAVMYDGLSPRFFFCLLLLLPLLGFCMASYLIRGIHLQMKADPLLITKGEASDIQIIVKNSGILPIPFLRFILFLGDGIKTSNHNQNVKLFAMLDARAEETFTYQIQPERCGKINIHLKETSISDYLCLMVRRIREVQELEVTVLPPVYPIDVRVTGKTAGYLLDGEEFSKVKSGEDPSELFDVRQYRPGDRQQRIHWKMSARTGKLMVKEFSQPLGNKVVLFLDLNAEDVKHKKRWNSDSFYEIIISFSYAMISEQVCHYVVWFQAAEGKIHRENIQSESDVFQMMNALFEAALYSEDSSFITRYDAMYGRQSYCTAVCLDTDLNLQLEERDSIKIPENKIKETLAEFVLEL